MGAVSKIEPQEVAQSNIITPAAMIQQAIASGSGIEVMERLLALQERHDAFQARKAFDDAMADLRADMPTIVKGQAADFGKGKASYKFEDLSAVTEALSPIMANVGLSFRWRTQSQQHGVAVTCIISHREGHSEETTLFAGFDTSGSKNAIQALGSAVTYLQRYTLKAAVGVAAAKDDDGQEAGGQNDQRREPNGHQPRPTAFEVQSKRLREAATIPALKQAWIAITNISEADLPQDKFDALSDICNDRQAELSAPQQPTDKFGFDAMESEIPFPGDLPPASAEAVRNLRG